MLVACATPLAPPWPEQRAQLGRLSQWHLDAQMRLQAPTRRLALNIDWRQHGERWHLCFRDFLRIARLCAKGDRRLVTLLYPRQPPRTVTMAQLRARNTMLGIELPVIELMNWLKGLPLDQGVASPDGAAPTDVFESGWRIAWRLRRPHRHADGHVWLPSDMSIERDQIQIRLSGMRWDIDGGGS